MLQAPRYLNPALGAGPRPIPLAKSNFFPLTEKTSYILLPVSQ